MFTLKRKKKQTNKYQENTEENPRLLEGTRLEPDLDCNKPDQCHQGRGQVLRTQNAKLMKLPPTDLLAKESRTIEPWGVAANRMRARPKVFIKQISLVLAPALLDQVLGAPHSQGPPGIHPVLTGWGQKTTPGFHLTHQQPGSPEN